MVQPLNTGQALTRAKKAFKKGDFKQASEIYNAILSHQPNNPVAKKALSEIQKSVLDSSGSQSHNKASSQEQVNALIHLINSGQLIMAEKKCNHLLDLHPQDLTVLNILAGSFTLQGKLQQAVSVCNEMIQLKPDFATAYYNRGVALQQLKEYTGAIDSFRAAIKQKHDYAQAHSDLSLIMLLLGNFKEGWKEHEWRMMAEKAKSQVPVAITKWNGESLAGKRILVRAEQGIGDEVMFASCFSDLIKMKPEQIIIECDSRLVPLFSRSFPSVCAQGKREEKNVNWLSDFGEIDFQVAMGSLPLFFRPDLDSFPDRKSFLMPDLKLLEKWKTRLAEIGDGMKVGISWRGGSNASMKQSRSIALENWQPVLQSGAHIINLQYGNCVEDIEQIRKKLGVHIYDWSDADPLTDLDNFMAQIAALDLVISIDNSTVHFAGAVGVPVWVLMPVAPDWRWLLDRDDSPWYSTVKLLRQTVDEDWSDVFTKIQEGMKLIQR